MRAWFARNTKEQLTGGKDVRALPLHQTYHTLIPYSRDIMKLLMFTTFTVDALTHSGYVFQNFDMVG